MGILDLLKPIHILAGSLALISGVVAMAAKKGQKVHRLGGRVFFWSMTVTCLLGLLAGIFRTGYLLFVPIALISYYQVATGYRILYIKNLHKGQKPALVDWVLTGSMVLIALTFFVWGAISFQADLFLAVVFFAFSTIGLYCTGVDLYHYIKKPTDKNYWLFTHIFRMSHGFIAALTAFLVNNSRLFKMLPQILLFIIPIAIGQPLVSYTIWAYKKRKKKLGVIAGYTDMEPFKG